MFVLLAVLAAWLSLGLVQCLYHIANGKDVVRKPMYYVGVFPKLAGLLAFVIYALLNWA